MYVSKFIPTYVLVSVSDDLSRVKVESKLSPLRALFLDESYDRAARMVDVYLEDADPTIRSYTDMLIGMLGSVTGILFGATYNCAPSNDYNLTQSEQTSTMSRYLLNPERDFVKNTMTKVLQLRGQLSARDIINLRDDILRRATKHTISQPFLNKDEDKERDDAKSKATIKELDKLAMSLFENVAPTEKGTVSVAVADEVAALTDVKCRVSDAIDEGANEFVTGSIYVDTIDRRVREKITDSDTDTLYQDCEIENIGDRVFNITNNTWLFKN